MFLLAVPFVFLACENYDSSEVSRAEREAIIRVLDRFHFAPPNRTPIFLCARENVDERTVTLRNFRKIYTTFEQWELYEYIKENHSESSFERIKDLFTEYIFSVEAVSSGCPDEYTIFFLNNEPHTLVVIQSW